MEKNYQYNKLVFPNCYFIIGDDDSGLKWLGYYDAYDRSSNNTLLEHNSVAIKFIRASYNDTAHSY